MEPLLEREDELAVLARGLAGAAAGSGQVVVIAGEAGIGKSELVTTFLEGPDAAGVRRAIGRCDALATPRALGPFLDIARVLGLPAVADRDELFGALLDDVAAAPGPTVLVVEDAHWADVASIELLTMLGRRAAELPALLVVTLRDDEVVGDHPLHFAIGDLVTSRATTYLTPAPLSRDAIATLASSGTVEIDLDTLVARTGGNPFHVTEVLAAPGQSVPTSVRLAVLARAARLDPAARTVVDAVSIVPGRTERWLLDAVAGPVAADLQSGLDRGMLVAGDDAVAFRHELARLAIEGQLGAAHRRELHRRAMDALASRDDRDAARLAHHAAGAGDEEVLARASLEAAGAALRGGAHREAAQHGAIAMRHERTLDPVDRARIRTTTARALDALGRSDEAATLARDAAEQCRGRGDPSGEAEAQLVVAGAMMTLGLTDETLTAIARARTLLEAQPPSAALAAVYLRETSAHMLARDRDAAVAWGRRAVALATELGDDELLGRALVEYGTADVMDSRFEGLDRIRAAIDLGHRRGLPTVVAAGYRQLGSGCGELRRYDLAVPALEAGVAWSASHHLEASRRYCAAWLARCRFDLGEWDVAERLVLDALGGLPGPSISAFVALNTLGRLRARRGDDDVWPVLDEALAIARTSRHLQRLWPVAVARAEAGWLDGDISPHVTLLVEQLAVAERCRHRIAIGELGRWLAVAGRADVVPVEQAARAVRRVARR